jgi:thiamine biosynthesis protein ThiI
VKYGLIIIRYAEIALKSKETRKRFENTLLTNIKNAIESKNLKFKIKKEWGRIYIYTNQNSKCITYLQKIFGIKSISPALQTESNIDLISKLVESISKELLNKKKTFAIRATRTGEHDFSSQDIAIKIGDAVVKATKAKVNLNNPDVELFIEVRNIKAFIFTRKIYCVGGLPYGSQGNVLALIDDPASILASWYLIRRGCKTIFINRKKSNEKILDSFIDDWFVKSEIFTINSSNRYNKINKIIIEKNCNAIVTGHTLDRNPLKTLWEIKQLKKFFNMPILHPLIAMNEKEINKKCREIGISK